MDENRTARLDARLPVTYPESKLARRAQLCASHWVQGSPLPHAAQAIIPHRGQHFEQYSVTSNYLDSVRLVSYTFTTENLEERC
jgi:hypothetical protein